MITNHLSKEILQYFENKFAGYPYLYFGGYIRSLLIDMLGQLPQQQVILPAFICPSLSAAIQSTGKKIVHIDVAIDTLNYNLDNLFDYLNHTDVSKSILFVSHNFGYPFKDIETIKVKYPELYIIEDCAHSLGAKIRGKHVGEWGDITLFSLYKLVRENNHGAIALSKSQFSVTLGEKNVGTLLQIASANPLLNPIAQLLKRTQRFSPEPALRDDLPTPPGNVNTSLSTLYFFLKTLKQLDSLLEMWRKNANSIKNSLGRLKDITFILEQPDTSAVNYYLTFYITPPLQREIFLNKLTKEGIVLSRAWEKIPTHYTQMKGTFPYGDSNSRFLAKNILHIPLCRYHSKKSQEILIDRFMRNLG